MKQSSLEPSPAIASAHSTANGLTVSERRWELIFGTLLIAVTFLVYQPAWNGSMLADDSHHMITTRQERSLQGLSDLWFAPHTTRQYHPFLDTVYWIEANLWGQSYLGYHLVTLSLHAISVLLLWAILRRLKIPAPWLAAAIFALHPVHVESVAWMIELKNTLSGFFFFSALLAYLQFDEKRTAKWYALVVVLFVMGILVKAIVATLPAVVLIILWWQRRKLNWKRDIQPLIPFLVLGAAAGILTAWMERAFAGAEGEEFEFSPVDRLLIAGRAFWFYPAKVFWPANLTLIYPRWKVDSSVWWLYLFPLSALCFLVWSWIFGRQRRWLPASVLFFVLTIGPFLGFFNVNYFRFSLVADHFQYLPSLGVIIPVSAGLGLLIARFEQQPRAIAYGLCALLLATLATLSWQQAHFYRDNETLFRGVIEKNPTSWEGQLNFAGELMQRESLDEAIDHFQRILELNPNNAPAVKRAYLALANISMKRARWNEAVAYCEKALQADPNFATAHNFFGMVLHRQGKLPESIAEYETAVQLQPTSAWAHNSLAWMLATCSNPSLRDGPRALALAQKADQLSGDANPRILRSLAAAYAENGRFAQAIESAQRALQLTRDEGETPFSRGLRNEIARYEMARPYHEAAD